ncbi:MAG: amino acid permease [Myxococcales bacterium]|nr:amino acid permease [Myxococcales bacterium]
MTTDVPVTLRRTLGVRSSAALIVGNIIGMGVFLTPAEVARAADSGQSYLLHWIVGALVAGAGALVAAELGMRFPHAGGDYVFLDRAYGRPVAVAWGWMSFLLSFAACIAAMAVGLGETLASITALSGLKAELVVIAGVHITGVDVVGTVAVMLATLLNLGSVRLVGRVQLLVAGGLLLGFSFLGLFTIAGASAQLGSALSATSVVANAPTNAFGSAIAAVFFTYTGWNVLTYVGGDVRDPQRTIPRAVMLSVALVALLYLLLNIAFLLALPLPILRETPNAGVALARKVLGPTGGDGFAVLVALAILSGLNSSIMAGSRVALALSGDGHLWRPAARIHPRLGTPVVALLAQAAWVIALVLTGSFGSLVTLSGSVMILLSALTVSTIFIFRRRDPTIAALPGHPVAPALYLAFAAFALVMVAMSEWPWLLAGAGLFALLTVRQARIQAAPKAVEPTH